MMRVPQAFRRLVVPLASYYAVTLALPVANGAARADAFVDHALVVLVVPPIIVLLACAGRAALSCYPRRVSLPVRRAANLLHARRAQRPARPR
jgi:hypothetical protein